MTALGRSRRVVSLPNRPARSDADEVVSRDYEQLKPEILRTVRSKLRTAGIVFDDADLESFYNQAWHALYLKLAAGDEIENRIGLLVSIAYRRALDEHRSLRRERCADASELDRSGRELDLAARLDDAARLRRLREGMRDRLQGRELEAAALCYVHDYSRGAAARVLGIRPKRMQKLMDDVSKKFALLIDDLDRTDWCDSRRSLIKAYALGLLDSDGRRHALASEHLRACPACRRRVLALRGLAAVAPPAPFLAHLLAGGEKAATAAAALSLGDVAARTDRRAALLRTAAAVAASAAVGSVGTIAVLDGVSPGGHTPPASALLETGANERPVRTPSPERSERERSERDRAGRRDERRLPPRDRRARPKAPARPLTPAVAPQATPTPRAVETPQPTPAPAVPAGASAPAEQPPLRDGWQEFELG